MQVSCLYCICLKRIVTGVFPVGVTVMRTCMSPSVLAMIMHVSAVNLCGFCPSAGEGKLTSDSNTLAVNNSDNLNLRVMVSRLSISNMVNVGMIVGVAKCLLSPCQHAISYP